MQPIHRPFAEMGHGAHAAPAIEAPRSHEHASQTPFHIGAHGAAMERLRILIVEDDVTVGPLLAEMLEDLGHVVCAVEIDLANAVAASARCGAELMIVDVGLGEVRGAADISKILCDSALPCVFVSDDTFRVPSRVPGAVLIRKPFRGPEIVAAIGRAMAARG